MYMYRYQRNPQKWVNKYEFQWFNSVKVFELEIQMILTLLYMKKTRMTCACSYFDQYCTHRSSNYMFDSNKYSFFSDQHLGLVCRLFKCYQNLLFSNYTLFPIDRYLFSIVLLVKIFLKCWLNEKTLKFRKLFPWVLAYYILSYKMQSKAVFTVEEKWYCTDH